MSEIWLALGFFLFVLLGITGAGYVVMARSRMAGEAANAAPETPMVVPDSVSADGLGGLVRLFQLVGQAVPGAKKDNNALRAKLVQAGYRLPTAVHIYYGIKCASALMFSVLLIWAALAFGSNVVLPIFCGLAIGYLIPDRVLDLVVKARAGRLRHGLPAALDMLVLAVEAGQSIDQALIATARGIKNTNPDLASELTVLHLESRATNNRAEALRNLALRNKDPEIKKFAGLLIDTDRFGTSVGPALRDHAKYLRIRFRQQAQEAARKVGVKLIFPVFFLIFPSVVLVTLGPAVILIFTQMKGLLGN